MLSLYPNPANDELKINSTERIKEIIIYSLLGEKVMETDQINGNNFSVNIVQLKEGLYTISVISEKTIQNRKLIVRR